MNVHRSSHVRLNSRDHQSNLQICSENILLTNIKNAMVYYMK